jgi:hypothetical protein
MCACVHVCMCATALLCGCGVSLRVAPWLRPCAYRDMGVVEMWDCWDVAMWGYGADVSMSCLSSRSPFDMSTGPQAYTSTCLHLIMQECEFCRLPTARAYSCVRGASSPPSSRCAPKALASVSACVCIIRAWVHLVAWGVRKGVRMAFRMCVRRVYRRKTRRRLLGNVYASPDEATHVNACSRACAHVCALGHMGLRMRGRRIGRRETCPRLNMPAASRNCL